MQKKVLLGIDLSEVKVGEFATLTSREEHVLIRLARGKSYGEISEELALSGEYIRKTALKGMRKIRSGRRKLDDARVSHDQLMGLRDKPFISIMVDDLPIPVRVYNALRRAKITNLQEFVEKRSELVRARDVGQKFFEIMDGIVTALMPEEDDNSQCSDDFSLQDEI